MSHKSIISNRKYFKRNKVLNIIRSNENISRFDVKKMTLYSISTVSEIIGELIESGLVIEEECDDVRVGRKPVWLRLNPQGAYFIGIEFNAIRLHCAMLNFVGEIVWKSAADISRNFCRSALIELIIDHIEQAMSIIPSGKERVHGICVGVPGYIDKETGMATPYSHLKEWENIPIWSELERHFSLPCYLNNNVNVMAFAYKWLYFNGEAKDFVFVSMRMGVRIVPVINNELILSKTGLSGELGHIRIPMSSRICSCGKFGCLNSEISDTSIVSIIKEGIIIGRFDDILKLAENDPDKITTKMFCDSVLAGHKDSLALMHRTAAILGEALSIIVNIFSPELIVLSGSLSDMGDVFLGAVLESIKEHSISENLEKLVIERSAFDKHIGAIGAAALVMQEEFAFIDQQV